MAVRMTASTSAARRRANGFAAFRGPSLTAGARRSRNAAARSTDAGRGGAWDELIWIERSASSRAASADGNGSASAEMPSDGATVESSSGGRRAAGKASRNAEPGRAGAPFRSTSWKSSEADISSGGATEGGLGRQVVRPQERGALGRHARRHDAQVDDRRAELDAVAALEPRLARDPLSSHVRAVRGLEVLDDGLAVIQREERVRARNGLVLEADGRRSAAAERCLAVREGRSHGPPPRAHTGRHRSSP